MSNMVFTALCVLLCATQALATNPVIGVLSQYDHNGVPYIAASYVKYLESAGARVVPILHTDSSTELKRLFSKLNGFFIPGGGANLANFSDDFMEAAGLMVSSALEANSNGDFFPVWGTCLGFETLNVLIAQDASVLESGFDSENLTLPLDLAPGSASSRMLSQLPANLYSLLSTTPLTLNSHQSGVAPDTFAANARLSSFFTLVSTNKDRKGREFVSTIEGKNMPFYATQWHPEKNTFEWGPTQANPHSADAVMLEWYMARFFVNEARKSSHSFTESELLDLVIWNYNPVFTGKDGGYFEQTYYFEKRK